jgi:hypothetical protein
MMFRPHIVLICLTVCALIYTFIYHSYVWPSKDARLLVNEFDLPVSYHPGGRQHV